MDRLTIETTLAHKRQRLVALKSEIAKVEGGIEALEELLGGVNIIGVPAAAPPVAAVPASVAALGGSIEAPAPPKPRPATIDVTGGGGARSARPR